MLNTIPNKAQTSINTQNNLQYITAHKNVFNIEYLYPLDLFENFAENAAVGWGLECSCKIQQDQMYPARFSLFCDQPTFKDYQAIVDFFKQVGNRIDVILNYSLIWQFIGDDFDFSKVIRIVAGVDLRKNLLDSRLKFWVIFVDYPQKLAQAVSLCRPSQEIQTLLTDGSAIIGFDFLFNGRTEIEIYASLDLSASRPEFGQTDIRSKLTQILSPPALQLLNNCWSLLIGCSQANPEKILYYGTQEPNDLIAKVRNDFANQVHAYYREQTILNSFVALREREIIAGRIENLTLYYNLSC